MTALEPTRHPRKPWLAGLLAMFVPGLGHLYAGRLVPGLLLPWLPGSLFLLLLAVTLGREASSLALLVAISLASLAVSVGQVVWAVRAASVSKTGYVLRRYNSVLAYFGFTVASWLVGGGLSSSAKAFVVESFKVPAASMLPSILINDHVFASKLGERNHSPRRGDMFVFRSPARPETNYIKRVVGLPGDTVAIVGGALQVNGQPVPRKALGVQQHHDRVPDGPWVSVELEVFEESLDGARYLAGVEGLPQQDFGPEHVPEGHYFMLGDHRDNSQDSRHFGSVPAANLVGRVTGVWYSFGPDGMRWDRLGLRL
ncbi:MAG: signal peptidase I [Myxococcales bacterium]